MESSPRFFTEIAMAQIAMRYNPHARRQLAAFSCGTAADGGNELVAIVDDHGIRKVVRDVASTRPDVTVTVCPRVTGTVVADALGISSRHILVQEIDWERLEWFFETEAGSAFRNPNAA